MEGLIHLGVILLKIFIMISMGFVLSGALYITGKVIYYLFESVDAAIDEYFQTHK